MELLMSYFEMTSGGVSCRNYQWEGLQVSVLEEETDKIRGLFFMKLPDLQNVHRPFRLVSLHFWAECGPWVFQPEEESSHQLTPRSSPSMRSLGWLLTSEASREAGLRTSTQICSRLRKDWKDGKLPFSSGSQERRCKQRLVVWHHY